MRPINVRRKFDEVKDHWDPHVVGELNGQQVKIARLKGEFVRHQHEEEDEMFLVIEGELQMEFDDRTETINEGEFIIVPKGIYHKPIAREEVKVMLFEPATTLNTGDIESDFTKKNLKHI